MTEKRPLYFVPKASFAYVCRGAGILARLNRRQASASRICDGSLYIALRLIRVILASELPCPAGSRIILQDGFDACKVRFPLFLSAKASVLKRISPSPGTGTARRSPGLVVHTSSLAPRPGLSGSVRTPRPGRNPVT